MLDPTSIVETAGYLGLFIIIFSESGLLIGFFLPGDSLLFTAGFLASAGFLNIFILVPLMFVAAITGDALGYLIGKHAGPRIFSRPRSLLFSPENVEKTRTFFERYGAKTILLARFIPAVRTFAPVMAGVGEMRYRTFALYNAIGAFLWGACMPILGYLFGQSVPNADEYIVPVVLLVIVVSILPGAWQIYKGKRNK